MRQLHLTDALSLWLMEASATPILPVQRASSHPATPRHINVIGGSRLSTPAKSGKSAVRPPPCPPTLRRVVKTVTSGNAGRRFAFSYPSVRPRRSLSDRGLPLAIARGSHAQLAVAPGRRRVVEAWWRITEPELCKVDAACRPVPLTCVTRRRSSLSPGVCRPAWLYRWLYSHRAWHDHLMDWTAAQRSLRQLIWQWDPIGVAEF